MTPLPQDGAKLHHSQGLHQCLLSTHPDFRKCGTTRVQKRFLVLKLPFEVRMIGERVHGLTAVSAEKLELLSSIFERLWRLDEAGPFARLMKRIDEAVIRQRCHSRIVRLHRMLERDYAR